MQEKSYEIITPQYISRKAFYTIPLFGITSLVAFFYDFQRLSLCCFGLMLTSFAHWNLLKKNGIERNVDRIMVVITYTILFLDSTRFCPKYKSIWNLSTALSMMTYSTNQFIFYRIYETTIDPVLLEQNSIRSTYIHLFFLHVLPNLSCIYGIITAGNCIE